MDAQGSVGGGRLGIGRQIAAVLLVAAIFVAVLTPPAIALRAAHLDAWLLLAIAAAGVAWRLARAAGEHEVGRAGGHGRVRPRAEPQELQPEAG